MKICSIGKLDGIGKASEIRRFHDIYAITYEIENDSANQLSQQHLCIFSQNLYTYQSDRALSHLSLLLINQFSKRREQATVNPDRSPN